MKQDPVRNNAGHAREPKQTSTVEYICAYTNSTLKA